MQSHWTMGTNILTFSLCTGEHPFVGMLVCTTTFKVRGIIRTVRRDVLRTLSELIKRLAPSNGWENLLYHGRS